MKKQNPKHYYLFLLLAANCVLNAQVKFNSLDSALSFADKNSSVSKTTTQQSLLAKYTKIAALGNTINFRSPVSFSATDNLLLPVNFIPAEAFGGPAGTFRQITLGQEYVSNFNINPQIDIINPYNWAKVKSASANVELTELSNQMNRKALYESIAAAYYNCLSLQEQIKLTEKNLALTDSIAIVVRNKFDQGISREQDLNNAIVTNINVKDKLQQMRLNLAQQINSLKVLCDIPSGTSLLVNPAETIQDGSSKPLSMLQMKYSLAQSKYAKSELRAARFSMFPVLSFVYYQGWQQNSNNKFFDNNSSWIQSKYIGLKLSIPFPPEVSKLSQSYTNKVNYKIAAINADHTKLQSELSNESLWLDSEKAIFTFESAQKINELKQKNYNSSFNQYKEGILATDNLLTAFIDMLNSNVNAVAAKYNADYYKSKIKINNSFK